MPTECVELRGTAAGRRYGAAHAFASVPPVFSHEVRDIQLAKNLIEASLVRIRLLRVVLADRVGIGGAGAGDEPLTYRQSSVIPPTRRRRGPATVCLR